MSVRLQHLVVTAATILAATAAVIPAPADAAPSCGQVRENGRIKTPARLKVPASCARPGSTIWIGEAAFTVPAPGSGVEMHDVLESGVTGVDVVFSNVDDSLEVVAGEAESDQTSSAPTGTASPSACSDTAKSWSGNRNNGYEYYVSSAEYAPGVSATTFSAEIDYAHAHINTLSNDCGLAEGSSLVSINITRKGSTGLRAAYTDGSCASDGYDVIDFGYLPTGVLGRSCTKWTSVPFADNRINEADIRLNKANSWFRYIPAGCYGAYEIAGVLVHEMGHTFGMGHVSESAHGNLTMSTNGTTCSYADSTLGRGDYNNLVEHYS